LWIPAVHLYLTHNRDSATHRFLSPFLWVALGDKWQQIWSNPVELEQCIAARTGPIASHRFLFGDTIPQHLQRGLLVVVNPPHKRCPVNLARVLGDPIF